MKVSEELIRIADSIKRQIREGKWFVKEANP